MEKTFDAVRFQRKARERLSREYLKGRNSFLKRLKEKAKPSYLLKIGSHN